VELVVTTSSEFLSELLKPRKAGLFETIVRFTDEVRLPHPPQRILLVRHTTSRAQHQLEHVDKTINLTSIV
jgi:hypothetical protein